MNEAFWHPTRELPVQICGGCATYVRGFEIEKDATVSSRTQHFTTCVRGGMLVLESSLWALSLSLSVCVRLGRDSAVTCYGNFG